MTAKSKSNEIKITRMYDAPVKMVWEAWTDPKQVAQWWGPRGFTITTHSKDLKVGGSWHFKLFPVLMFLISQNAVAYPVWKYCIPADVAVFPDRVHLKCSNPDANIYFFAVSTRDREHANRVLSLFTSGFAAGHPFNVYYDTADYSGGSFWM